MENHVYRSSFLLSHLRNVYPLRKVLTMMKFARRLSYLKIIINVEEIKNGYTKFSIKICLNLITSLSVNKDDLWT